MNLIVIGIISVLLFFVVMFFIGSTTLLILKKKNTVLINNPKDTNNNNNPSIVDFDNPKPLEGDVRFYNNFKINGVPKDIIVVLVNGTFNDKNDWTNIPLNGNDDGNKQKDVPVNGMERYFNIKYGGYHDITFPLQGVASLSYRVRVNCDSNMNCELGDSVFIKGLDPDNKKITKPPLDTKIEFSPGCILVEDGDPLSGNNSTRCSFNPSIIQTGATDKLDVREWFMNGNKIDPNGIPIGDNFPFEGSISKTSFFDISAVDGYTVPVSVYIKRPSGVNKEKVKCSVNNGKLRLDDINNDITNLMDCRKLDITKGCPIENINPNPLPNQPPMNYDENILNDIPLNTTLDLTYYRDPSEKGVYSTNIIGCAQPCTAFTHTEGSSQNYPKVGGNNSLIKAGQIATPTTSGVNQICSGGDTVTSIGSKTEHMWSLGERGYYIKNFPPEVAPNNTNQYYDPSNGSQYVNTIDTANLDSKNKCLAYAWAYNDELKNIAFDIVDPSNIIEKNGVKIYQRFKMLVIIG